jgi:hypothetical protein
MRLSRHSLLYLFALVLALSPAPATGGVITGSVHVSALGPGFIQNITDPNAVSIIGSDSGSTPDFSKPFTTINADGHGSLFASYGIIKISGDASGEADSSIDGRFQDFITMTAPGVANGTSGTFTFSIFASGLLIANDVPGGPQALASASWDLTVDVGGTPVFPNQVLHKCGELRNAAFAVSGYVNCSNTLLPGDSFGTYTVTVPIIWGASTLLLVDLSGATDAGYDPPSGLTAGASEDLSHSLYWAGISGATAGGNSVSNFVVTSQSGANFANSFVPAAGVPEPSSGWGWSPAPSWPLR